MKQFLATDSVKLNDTFEKTIETVEIIQGSGFIREGDEFRSYAQFNAAYCKMAGVQLRSRQDIEKYLSRIGLMFIEQGDTKVIVKVGDEVGNMLYDSYIKNDETAIGRMNHMWQGESREKINQFLRDEPWEKVEGRLRYSDFGLPRAIASAIFIAKPETRLFEITEADFEVNLPEGSLWSIDRAYKIVGIMQPKRADISCVCGKKMKMYRVRDLESGTCLSCRSCARRTADFATFYQSISNEGYVVIKDFEESRPTVVSRIVLQCPDKTHQEYSTYQDNWVNKGRRCPSCSMNHVGEQKVREFLQSKGISFKEQVRFDGLTGVGNRQLSYDFQIELNEKSVLVEIDGSGHFAPTAFGGRDIKSSQQAYQQQVEHDRLKDDFAVQNNLRLVRIQNVDKDYTFIENALESILNGSTANHYGDLY